MVLLQRGGGVQLLPGGGVSKETHITCDFPGGGGSGPPNPPLDPHVGSPDATVLTESWSIKNLNKNEKYHPKTTKRKKSYLMLVEIASADPEGGQGVRTPPPWKNLSYMGFYRV